MYVELERPKIKRRDLNGRNKWNSWTCLCT
jgi:hypothetical protein